MTENRTAPQSVEPTRKSWNAPRVDDLPPLTDLTLATGDAIDGNCEIGSGCGFS